MNKKKGGETIVVHTKTDLLQMQSLSLDAKIKMTARRISDFCDYGDAYLSISGGKDRNVVLRPEKNLKKVLTVYGYPIISKEVAQTIEKGVERDKKRKYI